MAQTASRNKIKSRQTNDIPASTDIGVANSSLVKTALNASGSAPIYACRAWVNFNGWGTVAIRGSGNVSSITDEGTGLYTVNLTNAMEDSNYAVLSGLSYDDTPGDTGYTFLEVWAKTVSTLAVASLSPVNSTLYDCKNTYVGVFR